MNNDDLDIGATLHGFRSGQKVFNRYILKRILGKGGMGVVWLAHDEELDQDLALKFLPELVLMDNAAIEDLKKETRRSRQLTHKNIVRIHDLVRDERNAAISMEFVDGDTLSNLRMERPGCVMCVEDIMKWFPALLDALDYAHNCAHVIHRDIKPANIMLTRQGDLKITDFGIASSVSDSVSRVSTQVGSSGTPVYMSPQQMMGERPLPTDDIYSVGAMLYELITGKPPFFTGNIMMQVQNKVPPSMTERMTELGVADAQVVPALWEQTIASCLAKDPAVRPQCIGELASRLGIAKAEAFRTATSVFQPLPVSTSGHASGLVRSTSAFHGIAGKLVSGKSIWRSGWFLAAALVMVFALVVWQGRMVERLLARDAWKSASTMTESVPGMKKLSLLHRAASLRHGIEPYASGYYLGQNQYLDNLIERTSALEPDAANSLVHGEQTMLIPLFDATHRQRLTDMVADAQQRLRSWMQQAINQATIDSAQGNLASADARINQILPSHVFYSDFDNAINGVYATQVRWGLGRANSLSANHDYDTAISQLESLSAHANLVPEYVTTLARIHEDQVKYEIDQVLKVCDKNDFTAADQMLDKTASRHVLPEMVAAAKAQVRNRAQLFCISTLAASLQKRDTTQAQLMIERLAKLSGRSFKTTASMLSSETNLDRFVAALEEIGIRDRASGTSKHLDLVLVASLRSSFSDQSAVKVFLSSEYAQWSKSVAKEGLYGYAIHLALLSSKEGGKVDEPYMEILYESATKKLGACVLVEKAHSADPAMAARCETLQNSFLNYLLNPFSSWLTRGRVMGNTPVSIGLGLGKIETTHDKQDSSDSVRYKSGQRSVPNQQYEVAEANYRRAVDNYNQAVADDNRARSAMNSSTDNLSASLNALSSIATTSTVAITRGTMDDASRTLASTPRTILQDVYDMEPYTITDHTLTHRMVVLIGFSIGDVPVTQPLEWSVEKQETSREVTGNAAHGVPVVKPVFQSRDSVSDALTRSMEAVLKDRSVYPVLAESLYQQAEKKIKTLKLNERNGVDLLWSLRELWNRSGYKFPMEGEIYPRVLAELGLHDNN